MTLRMPWGVRRVLSWYVELGKAALVEMRLEESGVGAERG